MSFVMSLIISALAIFFASYIVPGVHIDSFVTALIGAVVLALVNAFLRPILLFFTLPITILTLGLFIFVVNAALVLLVSKLVPGFSIDNFWSALLFSLFVSVVSSLLQSLTKKSD
ncbi:phage holin family protein [Candidatus Roizmanbacteria bacterium]|nr:phage holin family protein [Candidatus Roizmanbacteria bacterium]